MEAGKGWLGYPIERELAWRWKFRTKNFLKSLPTAWTDRLYDVHNTRDRDDEEREKDAATLKPHYRFSAIYCSFMDQHTIFTRR